MLRTGTGGSTAVNIAANDGPDLIIPAAPLPRCGLSAASLSPLAQ